MQNGTKRAKGRPPSYDRAVARAAIRDAFWDRGLAATSLDDLVAATAMNRPSLYNAFGDKKTMYLGAIAAVAEEMAHGLQAALALPRLAAALDAFYLGAIGAYVAGGHGPRGCLILCTAATEAVADADVRQAVAGTIAYVDAALSDRLAQAVVDGDLPPGAPVQACARMAGALLHSLAIRARSGTARTELEALAREGVALLLAGAAGPPQARSGGIE
ncbi:TetR/AcrR family transcriptional regulator [Zavarzinia sp. CC-PAN008]|uniref:TetR/AcrR family transcriptional regulator n=1 Tax=Zavarzinia sp. CC-PAN008 TaxID=3243332 RepID=UPI003F747C2F